MGDACSELYFRTVNISGAWANNRSGKLEFVAKPGDNHNSMRWTRFGKIDLKVVNGHTREGVDYLNVFARNVGNVGVPVGGLLGQDDHEAVATPPRACARHVSLVERSGS